jgi:hypothetical protein
VHAEEPEQAVEQDEGGDAPERVRGADQWGDGALEQGDEVEASDVDHEEDAAEHEPRGEEGDEAPDHDLRRSARQAQCPAPGDEHPGELDAGDGEQEPGEDAARAEPREENGERLSRRSGLERGEDVARGGD